MTDFSCVIPTLNSGWSLAETLHSVLNQKDSVVRIIVVDSGSKDDTLQICKQFGVEVVYEPPGNMYRAINAGLRLCGTEWLAYINSDDLWYGDALSRLLRQGEASKADVVYGVCDCIDLHGRFLHSFNPPRNTRLISWYRLGVQPFAQPAAIFRRRLFERMGGFDETYRLAADFDFYRRAYVGGFHFSYLPGEPVSRFRLHKRQLSQEQRAAQMQEALRSLAHGGLSASTCDRINFILWRFTNVGNYIVRILRRTQLDGRFRLPNSMEPMP